MLRSYRGEQVQVVTGVTIGQSRFSLYDGRLHTDTQLELFVVQPIIANPGYSVTSLVTGTKVKSDALLAVDLDWLTDAALTMRRFDSQTTLTSCCKLT